MNNEWFPLSAAQTSQWFLYQFEPTAQGAHNNAFALRIQGSISIDLLEKVMASLLQRHPMLRAVFRFHNGRPEQSIAKNIEKALHVFDLRNANEEDIRQRVRRESTRAFSLNSAPLIRANVFLVDDEEAIFQLVLDHIISDGWSYWILLDEITESLGLYDYEIDTETTTDENGPSYLDYIQWQKSWLESAEAQKQWHYWENLLSHDLPVLQLHTDRATPLTSQHQQDIVSVVLDNGLSSEINEFARQQSSTLFAILLAAYQMLLHRHTGQNEILVGTAMPARNRKEWEGLIGDFVNPIAIGAKFEDDPSVAEVLRSVRNAVLNGMSNQDYPFPLLVEKLNLSGTTHPPIFQTMFVFQKARHGADVLALWDETKTKCSLWRGELELTAYPAHHSGGTVGYALSLETIQFENNVRCEFKFDSELFDRKTIETLARHYKNLLKSIVADPSLSVSRLSLIDDTERQQLLAPTEHALKFSDDEAFVHRRFELMAYKQPDAIAISFNDQMMSYGELNMRANQLAHYLIAKGVRPEDRVALFLERSLELIVGVLGILKAGGAYVPMDSAYPDEHIAHVLKDCTPKLLITQNSLLHCIPSSTPLLVIDDELQQQALEQQSSQNPHPQETGLCKENLAYIIYTSGSTGLPKGVMISNANVARLFSVCQEKFQFNANDVWTLFHSIAFDFSVWELWGALLYGGRLIIVPTTCARSTDDFYALLCEKKVTVLNQTPSAFRQLINAQACSEQAHSLRYVIFGGEALELHTLRPWYSQNKYASTQLINMYGITEITVHATYRSILPEDIETCNGSVIGEPLADLNLLILDQHLQPAPLDIAGEIYIGGAGVARGYWNRPELTAERFIKNPLQPMSLVHKESRLYKTGDLARRTSNNEIIYLGRNDFQVKIRGYRIELGEIEAKLAACDGISVAAVIAREDVPGDKRLVAYLIMKEGSEFSAHALRQTLSAVLPPHMIPSAFVCLTKFPLTPNGKLDRKALPAPNRDAVASRQFEAPQGVVEEAIAEAWRALLKVDRISRNDHFFELGGHSLLVVSLMDRLREQQLPIDVRTVFTTPVLHELAASIKNRLQANADRDSTLAISENLPASLSFEGLSSQNELLPLGIITAADLNSIEADVSQGLENIQEIYPLAPLQTGILFHHLMNTISDFYVLRTVLLFDTRSRLDEFLSALQKVINRHDVLRSSIRWEGLSQPVQIVHKRVTLPVIELDVPPTNESEEEDAEAWLCEHTDPSDHRLDLTIAPLLTAYVAKDKANDQWLLSLLHHHIISDHHTLKLVLADVAVQLVCADGSKHSEIPSKTLPYRNYVAQSLARSALEDEAYFKAQLSHIHTPTAPFGIYYASADAAAPKEQRYVIEGVLARQLHLTTRRQGVSPAVLFHLAWAKVLAAVCGLDEVVFGTVLSGRQSTRGAEHMLGVFINTLPLRLSLVDNTVASGLQATFKQLTDLLAHEMVPLAVAQRCSGVGSPLPLFTSIMNYRHTEDESLVYENGLPQLNWQGIKVIRDDERTHYPITFSINDIGQSFVLTMQSINGIDGTLLLNCFNHAVEKLVDALSNSPDLPLGAVDIVLPDILPIARDVIERQEVSVASIDIEGESLIKSGSVEHTLANIWSELLGTNNITMKSNFFDLGGHSLSLMQLSSRIRTAFGITIPVNALFELAVLRDMASMIRAMTEISSVDDPNASGDQDTEEFTL